MTSSIFAKSVYVIVIEERDTLSLCNAEGHVATKLDSVFMLDNPSKMESHIQRLNFGRPNKFKMLHAELRLDLGGK
jgi:hypothetical protein